MMEGRPPGRVAERVGAAVRSGFWDRLQDRLRRTLLLPQSGPEERADAAARERRRRGEMHLRQMLGNHATFREGQWEAVEAVVARGERVLVVQRTGWGKSMVYFLAARLLRERGAGPTLLISPLLSLMRNQIESAARMGVRACSFNSDNRREWAAVEAALDRDECDVLLVSPERLAIGSFIPRLLSRLGGRVGMLAVDEAHCISDWGHDFRPDYRRIARILRALPPETAVLATTATANHPVVADIVEQLRPVCRSIAARRCELPSACPWLHERPLLADGLSPPAAAGGLFSGPRARAVCRACELPGRAEGG